MLRSIRTPLVTMGAACLVIATATLGAAQSAEVPPSPPAAPKAQCGPGSLPEPGLQGRVSAEDVAAGRVADGYRCNTEVVGTHEPSGGYKVERYVDAAGNECAFYDTTLLFPSNAGNLSEGPTGVAVLDMSDPASPKQTATLVTPAMQTPHESLLLNAERGLLAAVAGNPIFAPGQFDIYDVSQDCRTPVLTSSLPVGVLGHESGFAPDGNTFYASSLGGGTLTAIDVADPSRPRVLYTGNFDTHAVTVSDDGNRLYLAAGAGFPRNEIGLPAETSGLVVLDVSEIQARKQNPQPKVVSRLTWPEVTIPQVPLPVTIGGRPYLVEIDEFSTTDEGRITRNGPRVGAARIIDISDDTAPVVVSNIRLEVHQRENRAEVAGDPGTESATGGYAGHYCNVPRREEPGIVACSMLSSGLRVFDIRDPRAPKEIAYFVAPVTNAEEDNAAFSSPSFVPERNEIWYSDGSRGLFVLRVTNGAWNAAAPAGAAAPPTTGQPPAGTTPPAAAAAPARSSRSLAATGPALPLGLAALLLAGAAVVVRRTSAAR
jgi:hypothetical protein